MRSNIAYTISNIVQAIVPFILIPFLARNLTIDGYGIIGIFQTISGLFVTLFGLGSFSLLVREFVAKYDRYQELLFACMAITVMNSIFVLLFYTFFGTDINNIVNINALMVYFSVSYSAPIVLINFSLLHLQLTDCLTKYILIQIGNVTFSAVFSVFLVMFSELDYLGRIVGMVIGSATFCLISLLILYHDRVFHGLNIRSSGSEITTIIKYGVPLLPHIIISFLLGAVDKFYMSAYYSGAMLSSYMLAFQISNIITVVITAVNKVYQPWFFSLLSKKEKYRERKVYFVLLTLLIIGFLLNFLLSEMYEIIVIYIFGDKYKGVGNFIELFVYGQLLGAAYQLLVAKLFYLGRTLSISGVSIFSFFIYILFLFFLPGSYGVLGVAISYVLAWFIRLVSIYFLIK